MFLRVLILATFIASAVTPMEAAEQSIDDTGRQIVSTPTPTPHRKKKSRKKRSPSASPVRVKKKTASPSPSQEEEKSPSPSPSETASLPTTAASGTIAPTSSLPRHPARCPRRKNQSCRRTKAKEPPTSRYHPKQQTNFSVTLQ